MTLVLTIEPFACGNPLRQFIQRLSSHATVIGVQFGKPVIRGFDLRLELCAIAGQRALGSIAEFHIIRHQPIRLPFEEVGQTGVGGIVFRLPAKRRPQQFVDEAYGALHDTSHNPAVEFHGAAGDVVVGVKRAHIALLLEVVTLWLLVWWRGAGLHLLSLGMDVERIRSII